MPAMSKPVSSDAVLRNLSTTPGYLVKVKSTHEQFLQIGKIVSAWDAARAVRCVRVCVYAYVGRKQGVTVVALQPSATDEALTALRALLQRWGESTVAVVTDVGTTQMNA